MVTDRRERFTGKVGELAKRVYRSRVVPAHWRTARASWLQRRADHKALNVPRVRETFNEKLRYKMLKDRCPLLTTFADKVAVRDYVERKVGGESLPELLLVTDDPASIREESLPREFALKTSHASGGSVIAFDDAPKGASFAEPVTAWPRILVSPDRIDWPRLRRLCERWLAQRYRHRLLEWAYVNVPPRILVEELLRRNGCIPDDFKFFTFNGRVRLIQVDHDRFQTHTRSFYSREWEPVPAEFVYPPGPDVPRPLLLSEMIDLAEALAAETDFVRVDLYQVDQRVVFGEMTNYPEGGVGRFIPDSFDRELGALWTPPKRYRRRFTGAAARRATGGGA